MTDSQQADLDALWERAHDIADALAEDGLICGWPDRNEVETVLRAAINGGFIALPAGVDQ